MFKKIFVTLIIIFSLPLNAWANIQVTELDNLPEGQIVEDYTVSPVNNATDELMPTWAVQKEVNHLQKNISLLNNVNWNVYVINQQIDIPSFNLDIPLAGYARYNPKPYTIFLFASPKTDEYVAYNMVAHEIGHMVRYEVMSEHDLQEYVNLRDNGLEHTSYYDKPEELFAEDFRWLFGSDEAKKISYQPSFEIPGEQEKEFILSKLLKTWSAKLEYYKIDKQAGLTEIDHARQVYNKKIVNGNIKEAESAHTWANQIRETIGLPL